MTLGSAIFWKAILNLVPASAPFTPLWARAPIALETSSMLNPSTFAAGAALVIASYSDVISVAAWDAVAESTSFTLPA